MLGALLRVPADEVHRRILEGLHAQGFDDLQPAHMALLQWPGPQGRRPSDLAAHTGMSRQAVNYLLRQLEDMGYLARRDDTDDRRARRIELTERGRALVPAVRRIVRDIEQEWARELGPDDFEQLRDLLERLRDIVQDSDARRAPARR
jgi:DNA-binding MarR family transcriptional regulator